MREEINNWWKQAKRDLESANNSLKSGDYYVCAFLCQQTIEKGLKAVILYKKKEKPVGHSLIRLGKLASIPENFFSKLNLVSPQYFLSKYPDASEDVPYELYDEKIAKNFLNIAEEVLKWINNQLE